MAKNKEKRSSTGKASQAEKPHDVGESKASADDNILSLDAGALANLTRNIEQKLKDGKDAANKKSQRQVNNSRTGTKKSPLKDVREKKETTNKPQNSNQGKKRNRDGEFIDKPAKGGNAEIDRSQDNILRKEILALGGSEEDFDLVAEVASDSEVEGPASGPNKRAGSSDDALRKELAQLLKDAGQFNPEIADDQVEEPSASEDRSGEEEDEDEDEIEDFVDANSSASEGDNTNLSSKKVAKAKVAEAADKKKIALAETQSQFPKEYSRLTIMPRADWYETELPSISAPKVTTGLPKFLVDRIQQHATSLLEKENQLYSQIQQQSSSSSHKFYSTIMTSGTLSDKISALTLAVQESPIHNIKALGDLVALSKKRSRAQAVDVLRSLKDLFAQGTLLPSDRKLKAFANHAELVAAFQKAGTKWTEHDPLPGGLQTQHLIVWAFEDYLKAQFFEILKVLEIWCNDEIEFSRTRAVSYVYELLKEKPEQEANLLRLLVNKLGDTGKKIASRASYLLLQLCQAHPLMKPTIIKSVEEFLFRPGQSAHAKYYAIITLNQTILSTKEEKVAVQLLDIYFAVFLQLLKSTDKKSWKADNKKKGKKDDAKTQKAQAEHDEQLKEKLIAAVLTGVNRAYPFTSSDTDRISKHLDTLFRVTHSSNFNTSIQALMLIQQLTATHQIAADRFYRTLYESLLDPRVATSSKQSLYLNLLYKALKNDSSIKRVKAFVKRLVQVLGLHQPSFICGVFFLIRELEKTYPSLSSLIDQPEEDESDEEEVFRDVPDEKDQQGETAKQAETTTKKVINGYDARKRDPQHSNADKSCLWELLPLLSHFHPSVSALASHLLNHEPLSGKPDLTLHTLTHFLDRFIYRNAKAAGTPRGQSIMQPLAGTDSHDLLVGANALAGDARAQVPVNSEAFWRQRAEDVAAEDVFFHEYFNRVSKDKTGKKAQRRAKDPVARDEEAGDESGNESEIWQALVESRPGLEDDDEDDDLDMDDLESAYDDEDVEGSDDGGVIFNDESDEEEVDLDDAEEEEEDVETEVKQKTLKASAPKDEDEDEDDEDSFDMDVSDEEAFRDSDEDLPSDLDVDMGGVALPASTADDDATTKKSKKRKLRHLPTFASMDDYAALLADEDDGLV
ncbi:CCAAT-box-binding transcription factor [Talaromyces stipitatus ATCC 10500]|uniref:CCAAT-box-binding transcription factor n=1 Tax=Talaromyces stipitatus (strain ATCC 10500 / CBS 375.48 / QM 6759 / NRRL 1006) TaxID=441959 RepID=B8LW91_TALSN|nr:CCAAT-box-binding transcription factor [Talaromyces stipitatus ATCC 10500]EED24119.1 CCAAT-box-binding transcription factor [Talaromyces stipitatus ATCC 10500]